MAIPLACVAFAVSPIAILDKPPAFAFWPMATAFSALAAVQVQQHLKALAPALAWLPIAVAELSDAAALVPNARAFVLLAEAFFYRSL